MIKLIGVTKIYQSRFGCRVILNNINLTIKPGDRIGILGRNGAGKSTLLRIIGGSEKQNTGNVIRNMAVSWPIGLSGGIQPTLSGIDNVKFICRIYNIPFEGKRAFIEDVTGLGRYLYEPVSIYSSGMRTKLALAISLMVDFDCYLVDEALSVGDSLFQKKYEEIIEKRKSKSLVLVSHLPGQIQKNCDKAYVLTNGELTPFENVKEAIAHYTDLKNQGSMELS